MIKGISTVMYKAILLLLLFNIYVEISDFDETRVFLIIASAIIGLVSALSTDVN